MDIPLVYSKTDKTLGGGGWLSFICIICKACFYLPLLTSPCPLLLLLHTVVDNANVCVFISFIIRAMSVLFVLPVRSVLLVLSAQNAIRVSLSVNSSCWQHPQQQQQLDCNWRHLIQQDCLSLGAFVGKGACERREGGVGTFHALSVSSSMRKPRSACCEIFCANLLSRNSV